VLRVVALPAPTEREKIPNVRSAIVPHLPAAGEIVIFDRSWYKKAGVERVMGFCAEEDAKTFLDLFPTWERAIVQSGIILIKYWFEVSQKEQTHEPLEAEVLCVESWCPRKACQNACAKRGVPAENPIANDNLD
jgi:polyphosphate kinase 2 (PPK2 family)